MFFVLKKIPPIKPCVNLCRKYVVFCTPLNSTYATIDMLSLMRENKKDFREKVSY